MPASTSMPASQAGPGGLAVAMTAREGQPFTVVGILSGAFPTVRILNRAVDLYVPLRLDAMPPGRRTANAARPWSAGRCRDEEWPAASLLDVL